MSAYVPQFPVGYHRLHRTKILDYQLNRWHSMGWLSLEEVREKHPGLFYEAVHHSLLTYVPLNIDHHLAEMLASTMLARTRPQSEF